MPENPWSRERNGHVYKKLQCCLIRYMEFCNSKSGFRGSRKTEVTFKLRPKNEQVTNQLMGEEGIPREGYIVQRPRSKREHVSARNQKVQYVHLVGPGGWGQ